MFVPTPDELAAVALSLKVSIWAVGMSLPLAVAVAWLLSRRRVLGIVSRGGRPHFRRALLRRIGASQPAIMRPSPRVK